MGLTQRSKVLLAKRDRFHYYSRTIMPQGLDQALSRMRKSFRGRIGNLGPMQFIEVQRSRVRLSTHPKFIEVDCDALLRHPDDRVRQLA